MPTPSMMLNGEAGRPEPGPPRVKTRCAGDRAAKTSHVGVRWRERRETVQYALSGRTVTRDVALVLNALNLRLVQNLRRVRASELGHINISPIFVRESMKPSPG